MTPHECVGVYSKVAYLEGSRPYISKELIKRYPSYLKRKLKGSSKYRDIIIGPIYHEPLKIWKVEDYYAEMDAKK